jgi:hypothetical protein
MIFLYISAFLTVILIVLFIYSLRPRRPVVIREVIVREEPSVYWMPWSWGWGGGASHVVRPHPHFAGLGTEHARRRPRRELH